MSELPRRETPTEFWKRHKLGFDERYWAFFLPLPTLLPARMRIKTTLVGVHGGTFVGVGIGERIFVVRHQHRVQERGITVVHPKHPCVLFYARRSDYTIG